MTRDYAPRGVTVDVWYLGYRLTLGHSRVVATDPDGHEVYAGDSIAAARSAIREDRRGGSVAQAMARAQAAQARRLGYRDAVTRFDPTDMKGDTA